MEIVMSGFGGQGILTAGLILIRIASDLGATVSWLPSYGSEMRGGTANCSVILSGDEIGSPLVVKPDVLLALNEPSVNKFEHQIKPGGILIANTSLMPEHRPYRSDIRAFGVDATVLANDSGNPRGINLVVLGAFIKASDYCDIDVFAAGVQNYFSDKGKPYEKNVECLYIGYANTVLL